MPKYDQILRNCRIINGCGTPWYDSDVAISGDKIAAIGQLVDCTANIEIDANKCYLAPGFIDSHTHDDIAILKDRKHLCKLMQGVTTIVTGNCSFSNYPSSDQTLQHLSLLLGNIDSEEIFGDFHGYESQLTRNGISVNVVSLVGHAAIRLKVMGYENRNANEEEVEKMCAILEQQLSQGAAGLSLGLVYPPSSYADQNELVKLGAIVRKYNRVLAAHIRCYSGLLMQSIHEFIDILKLSGAKGILSHLQIAGQPYWGQMQAALDLIENARNDGVDIIIDMYPYTAGSSSILQLFPPSALQRGFSEFINQLSDQQFYEQMRHMVESGTELNWESKIKLIGWKNVTISSVSDQRLKQFEGKTINESAEQLSMDCFEFAVHVIRVDLGTTNIIMFQQSPSDQNTVHLSRLQMVGSDGIPRGDGKPHPRLFGTFARVIGQLSMRDGLMRLEEAVRRMTSLTAHRFSIYNRGLIIPGLVADLVLFSDEFIDTASYETPRQTPKGLIAVWVNGQQVVSNGYFVNNDSYFGKVINYKF